MQRDQGNLRRAIEAEGNADGADPPIDVELHVAELEMSLHVPLAHGGKYKCSEEGQADLASVRVAGEHEIDKVSSWMLKNGIGVVGLMRHQNDGTIGRRRNGDLELRVGGAGVVDPAEPETRAITLNRNMRVYEHRNAVPSKSAYDEGSIDSNVMIAENCIA